jgi:hypothetical protein
MKDRTQQLRSLRDQYTDRLKNEVSKFNAKVPIYRGCPNTTCFCTGYCKEIIGWRDKIDGEL